MTMLQIITITPREKYVKITTRNANYLDIKKCTNDMHHLIYNVKHNIKKVIILITIIIIIIIIIIIMTILIDHKL